MARPQVAAVVVTLLALSCCCLFFHASSAADTSLSPGLRVLQEIEATKAYHDANDQVFAAVAGEEAEAGDGVSRRTDLELEDYPGSGANDRHSPWAQQRRN